MLPLVLPALQVKLYCVRNKTYGCLVNELKTLGTIVSIGLIIFLLKCHCAFIFRILSVVNDDIIKLYKTSSKSSGNQSHDNFTYFFPLKYLSSFFFFFFFLSPLCIAIYVIIIIIIIISIVIIRNCYFLLQMSIDFI